MAWWGSAPPRQEEMTKLVRDIALRVQRIERDTELSFGSLTAAVTANAKAIVKLLQHDETETSVLATIQSTLVTERMLMLDRIETLHREVLRLTSVASGVPDKDVITEKLQEIGHNINSEYAHMRERVDQLYEETKHLHAEARRLALEKNSPP